MATSRQGGGQGGSRDERGDAPDPAQNGQHEGAFRDPDEWKTGDEPMTAAQQSYLRTLATEAGVEVRDDLTKAEAAKRIEELQQRTGRGRPKH